MCYMFASMAGREYDWKVASKHCKKLGAVLAEMESIEENQDVIAHIQNDPALRGFLDNLSNTDSINQLMCYR